MRTHRVTKMLEDAGRQAGEAAFHKTQEYYREGRDTALSIADGVEQFVREQPIRSILITIGLVCLVTSAFVRR